MTNVTAKASQGLIYSANIATSTDAPIGINPDSNLLFYCGGTGYSTNDSNVSVWFIPFDKTYVAGDVKDYDTSKGIFRIPSSGLWTIDAKVTVEIGGSNGGINLSSSHLFKGYLQLLAGEASKWPYYGLEVISVGQTTLSRDLQANKVGNYYCSDISVRWTGRLEAMNAVQLRLALHNIVGQIDILEQGCDITNGDSDPYFRLPLSETLNLKEEFLNDVTTAQFPLSTVTFTYHGLCEN